MSGRGELKQAFRESDPSDFFSNRDGAIWCTMSGGCGAPYIGHLSAGLKNIYTQDNAKETEYCGSVYTCSGTQSFQSLASQTSRDSKQHNGESL